jgi:hypothetical protein
MTDAHQIANAKLSAAGRLNMLASFEQTEDVKQRWCREISNCIGTIVVIGRDSK